MNIIQKDVEFRLNKKGIFKPKLKDVSDFTIILFQLKDPLTNEVIREYSYTKSHYNRLEEDEYYNLSKLPHYEKFNEEKYQQHVEEHHKEIEKYIETFEKELEEYLKELRLNRKEYKQYENILKVFEEYIGVDYYSDSDKRMFSDSVIKALKI